ncbi:MAG: hypothetical protein IPN56_12500 [Chitinophagaceae bacterium]|nr:hypothetical protein [Chitinophagaceae bacterium]
MVVVHLIENIIIAAPLVVAVVIPVAVAELAVARLRDRLPGATSKGVGPDTSTPENATMTRSCYLRWLQ